MIPINLYANLQINPKNIEAYRKLSEYYLSVGMQNESEAFMKLVEKLNDNGPHPDQEQLDNHPPMS